MLWSDSVMGAWATQWLAVAAVATVTTVLDHARGCNVRELGEIIQRRFREEVAAQCGSINDKCSFDRECCKGLECAMSASQDGVGLSCQRAVLADPDRADMVFETPESLPDEPKSENGDWMVVKTEEDKEDEEDHQGSAESNEKMYPTDMLTEIENLQEKKKMKLLRENYELEKLFTEREEKELEQLRALREDADMDELRRLKELRLKRKIQLIKELKELRGLKAEEDFNTLNGLKKRTNASLTVKEPVIANEMDALEYNYSNASTPGTVLDEQTPNSEPNPQDINNVPKHKQGIHEVHHKRKHHHHKRKDPHHSLNSTIQAPERKENMTDYNAG